ncbi:MAG: MalY/PatB family protein [Longibaculum muris]|uniref:cysteine-S-conjugate beta-lyase n=1 Tax=Longibaculum muris TaxID=1796628 RepID=A0A4R3YMQ7_9FIRM|nr:MalY/PatB family protein [Longibaculum muris]MBS5370278.1 pyridoxal phosphate-dependent aminotransferase [Coprobacillus cateniformis]MCR1889026.1 pyridoxal phosphate-dependent aminotransferase [Longibaculum muris]MED9811164.1 MalY/PatB family protein [Longibaculum muris]TCV93596.1 cystathionine beta-lyase [Longibaculum muris]
MSYDFSKLTNRFDSYSMKWDVAPQVLPMWVADMDFETAPEIVEALHNRVNHKIFGYNIVPDEFFESIQHWWKKRHHFLMEKEWMMFCTGVVPAISSIVRKLTTVGENILIQAPVYNIFYNSILNNGRHVLSSDLIYDGHEYTIDFEDLEKKLALPQTTMMILCNPHNPIGKIWSQETLKRIGDLCARHHVLVVSDEIHCDIIAPGREYIPFASVSKTNLNNSITCIAPTKAFNLAGLQSACIVVENEVIRQKVNRGINTDEVAEPNSFAITAAMSAFNYGEKWLDELNIYIQNNKQIACQYIEENLPMLHVVYSEATYLLWIDCSKVTDDSVELVEAIKKKTGLYLSDGYEYGENGKAFVRMNVACPQMRLMDGLKRLREGVIDYQQNMK